MPIFVLSKPCVQMQFLLLGRYIFTDKEPCFHNITFTTNSVHRTFTAFFCHQWWTYGNMGIYELHNGSYEFSEVFLPPSWPLSTLWSQVVKLTCAMVSHPFRPRINLPAKMLLFVSLFSNMIHHRLGFQMFSTPLLHSDAIYFLSRTRIFNTSKARKLLGYYPIVSLEVSLFLFLAVLQLHTFPLIIYGTPHLYCCIYFS